MQHRQAIERDPLIEQKVEEDLKKIFAKLDLSPFASDKKFIPENFEKLQITIARKLVTVFNALTHLLPKKEKFTILSLGCGLAEEFLALKYIYGDTKLQYVGVDIKEEQTKQLIEAYRDIAEVTLLACDARDKSALIRALQEHNCLPQQGFDFIVLRQPNILSAEYGAVFTSILRKTIPFFSTRDGKVFISCYNEIEFDLVSQNLPSKFYSSSPGNAVMNQAGGGIEFEDGLRLQPDKCSAIVSCHGLALKNAYKLQSNYSHAGLYSISDVPHQEILAKAKAYGPNDSILAAVKDKEYGIALRKACIMGDLQMVEMLLEAQPQLGFDINEPARNNGWTALDCAQKINPGQKAEIIRLLLAKEAKTSQKLLDVSAKA